MCLEYATPEVENRYFRTSDTIFHIYFPLFSTVYHQ